MYRTAAVLFGLLGLVFAAGCASDQDGGSALTAPIQPAALSTSTTVCESIGCAGGVLSTGGVTLSIPAGALSADTPVTLTVTVDGGLHDVVLGPFGLRLNSKALLTIHGGSGSGLLGQDPATGQWRDAAPVFAGLALQARIINLSRYDEVEDN